MEVGRIDSELHTAWELLQTAYARFENAMERAKMPAAPASPVPEQNAAGTNAAGMPNELAALAGEVTQILQGLNARAQQIQQRYPAGSSAWGQVNPLFGQMLQLYSWAIEQLSARIPRANVLAQAGHPDPLALINANIIDCRKASTITQNMIASAHTATLQQNQIMIDANNEIYKGISEAHANTQKAFDQSNQRFLDYLKS